MYAGGDFVGGDFVAQRRGQRPREIFTGQLAPDQVGVIREEQDPAGKTHPVGSLGDRPVRKTLDHSARGKLPAHSNWGKRRTTLTAMRSRPPATASLLLLAASLLG